MNSLRISYVPTMRLFISTLTPSPHSSHAGSYPYVLSSQIWNYLPSPLEHSCITGSIPLNKTNSSNPRSHQLPIALYLWVWALYLWVWAHEPLPLHAGMLTGVLHAATAAVNSWGKWSCLVQKTLFHFFRPQLLQSCHPLFCCGLWTFG